MCYKTFYTKTFPFLLLFINFFHVELYTNTQKVLSKLLQSQNFLYGCNEYCDYFFADFLYIVYFGVPQSLRLLSFSKMEWERKI